MIFSPSQIAMSPQGSWPDIHHEAQRQGFANEGNEQLEQLRQENFRAHPGFVQMLLRLN
jgi:hypothetical protein